MSKTYGDVLQLKKKTEHKRYASSDTQKRCPACQEWKDFSGFYNVKKAHLGLSGYCRMCLDAKRRASNVKKKLQGPSDIPAKVCATCKEQLAIDLFTRHRVSPDGWSYHCKPCQRNAKTFITYGITREEALGMLALQDGKCGICKIILRTTGQEFNCMAIDHCHKNGHVRGILCSRCNKVLGLALDSIEVLKGAIMYLQNDMDKQ